MLKAYFFRSRSRSQRKKTGAGKKRTGSARLERRVVVVGEQEEARSQGKGELTRVNKLAQEFLKEITSLSIECGTSGNF